MYCIVCVQNERKRSYCETRMGGNESLGDRQQSTDPFFHNDKQLDTDNQTIVCSLSDTCTHLIS